MWGKYNILEEDMNKLRDIFESFYVLIKIEIWKFGNVFVFVGIILIIVGEYDKGWRMILIIMLLISLYFLREKIEFFGFVL